MILLYIKVHNGFAIAECISFTEVSANHEKTSKIVEKTIDVIKI